MSKLPNLRMPPINDMICCGEIKPFRTWNESTICTIETVDVTGARRGAVAIGLSQEGLPGGIATYCSIPEAEDLIECLQKAVNDAKRVERGAQPLAPSNEEIINAEGNA